jgi:DNA topoisomerase-3
VLADGEEGDVNPETVGDESLNVIQQDERGSCTAAEVQEHQSRPPAHCSEASLLYEMERAGPRGLGTPATRAETIEKLVSVNYLERTGRTLRALGKGRMAIAILSNSLLTSAELTADWEERLYAIEQGNYSRDEFMAGIRAFTAQLVDYFRGMTADDVRAVWPVVGRCPNGDGDVRESKKAYGCTSWQSAQQPDCGFVIWKRICGRTISPGEAAALLERVHLAELGAAEIAAEAAPQLCGLTC